MADFFSAAIKGRPRGTAVLIAPSASSFLVVEKEKEGGMEQAACGMTNDAENRIATRAEAWQRGLPVCGLAELFGEPQRHGGSHIA